MELIKITLDLPFAKTTRGAVLYEADDRTGLPFSNLYVRQDALRQPGRKGWPKGFRVTIEEIE